MYKLLTALVLVAFASIYFLYRYQTDTPQPPPLVTEDRPIVRIGNVPIRVEVADTPESRRRGLGGRESLDPTGGVLFIFDESGFHQIWMRNMGFVIDVIWVSEDLTVVDIKKALRPDTFPRTFEPRAPARFVIETNANYAESFGIAIGDKVTIPAELIPADLRKERNIEVSDEP